MSLASFNLEITTLTVSYYVAQDEDVQLLMLQNCRSLTALTYRLTFLAKPRATLPFNSTSLRLASQTISSAPASVRMLPCVPCLQHLTSTSRG